MQKYRTRRVNKPFTLAFNIKKSTYKIHNKIQTYRKTCKKAPSFRYACFKIHPSGAGFETGLLKIFITATAQLGNWVAVSDVVIN